MAVVPAPGVYNFTLVDDTWDFLLKNGVHPIVELSFMPAFIASSCILGFALAVQTSLKNTLPFSPGPLLPFPLPLPHPSSGELLDTHFDC